MISRGLAILFCLISLVICGGVAASPSSLPAADAGNSLQIEVPSGAHRPRILLVGQPSAGDSLRATAQALSDCSAATLVLTSRTPADPVWFKELQLAADLGSYDVALFDFPAPVPDEKANQVAAFARDNLASAQIVCLAPTAGRESWSRALAMNGAVVLPSDVPSGALLAELRKGIRTPIEEPLRIVIDPARRGPRIPEDFLGFSFESFELLGDREGRHQFSAENRPLVQLMKSLGIRSFRFGGNTVDAHDLRDPGPDDVDALFGFAGAAGGRVIYSFRFTKSGRTQAFDPADAGEAAKMAAHIMRRHPGLIASFTIGNEPDMYFSKLGDQYISRDIQLSKPEKDRRDYELFRAEWERFAKVIGAAAPDAKFNAPGTTGNANWGGWFTEDYANDPRIAFVNNHWYPGGNGKLGEPEPKLARMMSKPWAARYPGILAANGCTPDSPVKFRMDETSAFYNGGAPGVSDTMAGALWALEYSHALAAMGCDGVNYHTSPDLRATGMVFNYTSFTRTPGGYEVCPPGYGHLLFSLGSKGEVVPVELPESNANLAAFAVAGHDGDLYVSLINKEYDAGARRIPVTIALQAARFAGGGSRIALVAPGGDIRAKGGITVGGSPVGEDGTWPGRWEGIPSKAFSAERDAITVDVDPASALLLRLPVESMKPNPAPTATDPDTSSGVMIPAANPVWAPAEFNPRDPSVIAVKDGYDVYFSRFAFGSWGDPANWSVARVRTRDFRQFGEVRPVTGAGYASPGDIVRWHGRWILPFQSYPSGPVRLCYSESDDLENWTGPKPFLEEGARLPWNEGRRMIDPTFVVEGETLHCFFVGTGFRTDATGRRVRGNLMGHATTTDPALRDWTILTPEAPLMGFSESAPDGVENLAVFREGDRWMMLFSEGLEEQRLALATSTDLRSWSKEGPVALPTGTWRERKHGAPFVWREGPLWRMLLMGTSPADRTSFGLFVSRDGREWLEPSRPVAGAQ